jgi:hypothetical protein
MGSYPILALNSPGVPGTQSQTRKPQGSLNDTMATPRRRNPERRKLSRAIDAWEKLAGGEQTIFELFC